MIADLGYIKEQFCIFNKQIFGDQLLLPSFKITSARTYIGQFSIRSIRQSQGTAFDRPLLSFSNQFELTSQEWQDVIIHEMIHYHIMVNRIKDTSAHGVMFRKMMKDINQTYQRNIRISYKAKPIQYRPNGNPLQRGNPKRFRVIAVVSFTSGAYGFKVLPRNVNSMWKYYTEDEAHPIVQEINLFWSDDPHFANYPASTTPRVHMVKDPDEIFSHLTDAKRFEKHDHGFKVIKE